MSTKNFVSYGDAETLFTGVGNKVKAKADLTDLAPAFSTSSAYTVGQYVSYNGNIYKCTYAHSAGAWVAGDFTLVAVGSELNTINSKLAGLEAYDGFAGQSICYFESNNPNVEIYITGAGTSIESALGSEDASKNLYMIRFTADAPATLTARLFEYDEEYPVMIMNPDLPITYFDGTPFTRAIHAGDYIIIKLTAGPSSLTGGVIVADFDSTIREDMTDVIGWDNHKNLLPLTLDKLKKYNSGSGRVWNNNTLTVGDVTFTIATDNDGIVTSITANGTASTDIFIQLSNEQLGQGFNFLEDGETYIINGGSANFTVRAYHYNGTTTATSGGNDVEFTLTSSGVSNGNVDAAITSGTVLNNVIIRPMIRKASDIDPTFQPYYPVLGPSVVDHESRIEDLESDVNVINSNLTKLQVITGTVHVDSNGFVNLSVLDIHGSTHKYANAVIIGNDSYVARTWKEPTYGWIVTILDTATGTKVTDPTIDINIVVFAVAN